MSDPSEEESSSDESSGVVKRRKTQDTLEASSTTSHGSEHLQESDDDRQGAVQFTSVMLTETSRQQTIDKCTMLGPRASEENLRLSRSSMSDNRSSPYDRCSDKTGLSEQDGDSNEEGSRPHFQDTIEKTLANTQTNFIIQGEYSDKAQKMMSNMGFKPGKGLGKFEHGRVEPVESSNQKGRRGLGLRPSSLGAVPRDFKWSPDDARPEAEEEVLWMDPSLDEPLSRTILEEWLAKAPKKLTVEDETNFVDPEILHGVMNAKNIFDTLDEEDLRHARYRSNPFETIGAVIFLNRAAVKMANLDAICDFMFTKPRKPNGESMLDRKDILYFADVCAGPGGFSEYVLFRKGWRAKGFGFTLKLANDFKISDFYAGPPETFNTYYGAEDDGNIFNPANLSSLKDHVLRQTEDKGVHFLMADGGFSVEGQENLQEVLSKQLYLCQCLAALMLVRTGGHFLVKLFDIFTKFSVGLVYLMYRCFDQVSIHKPVTSRPANSERYLICKWKRAGTEAVEQHLFSVNSYLWRERDQSIDVAELVPLTILQEDKAFFNYIYNSNVVLGEKQIKSLMKLGEFCKNKHLKESSQAEMRERCLQLWQLPDHVRTQPERQGPQETLKTILSTIHHQPADLQNLPAFKSNILGRPPIYLEGIMDLKVFRSVYDWHFVFLSSGKSLPDSRFFIGCGGKQVYQLDGIHWMNAVDLHVTLPARTLIYAEVVKEYRGEGNTQVHSKALHIIDALMLGGVDVSTLPLTERLSQCSQFCAALEKPCSPIAIPIRCKRLWNMEHFSMAAESLEYRSMKRIKRAVTVAVPNRSTREEMFHIVGSVLFIKEIREPWEARISKRSGHKYYFGIDKDKQPRSEYFIPEEGRLDMLSAFLGRVLWPWEPASAILEGSAHEGLTRSEMEDFIERNSKQ